MLGGLQHGSPDAAACPGDDEPRSWAVSVIAPGQNSVGISQATGSLNGIDDEGTWRAAVALQMGVTLDGFVHGAKGYEDWGLPAEDDEVVAWKVASLREAGTHIMGRATYEAMASVWPNTTGVYADVMNEIPTVVFSKTLTRAEWAESRIADGDLAEDIDRLKREPGGVILAHGGATFVGALIHDGLIDEYRLVIHPVAIGHGTGLSARSASRYGST
jgi:dihydrofolate reductase